MRHDGLPRISPLVLCAVGAACSYVYPVRIERRGATAPARPAAHVEVLGEVPSRPFLEIARLTTESVSYDSPSHAVERLRSIAAEKGADAIIVERRGSRVAASGSVGLGHAIDFGYAPTSGDPVLAGGGGTVSSFARATAIRWTTPDDADEPDASAATFPAATRPKS